MIILAPRVPLLLPTPPRTLREVEFPFLTGGETMLLLRDLVRRKVLREHAVPDTSKVLFFV